MLCVALLAHYRSVAVCVASSLASWNIAFFDLMGVLKHPEYRTEYVPVICIIGSTYALIIPQVKGDILSKEA